MRDNDILDLRFGLGSITVLDNGDSCDKTVPGSPTPPTMLPSSAVEELILCRSSVVEEGESLSRERIATRGTYMSNDMNR